MVEEASGRDARIALSTLLLIEESGVTSLVGAVAAGLVLVPADGARAPSERSSSDRPAAAIAP